MGIWRKRERELEKEIQHHLQMAAQERGERGASGRDAAGERGGSSEMWA